MNILEDAINQLFKVYYNVCEKNEKIFDEISYDDIKELFFDEKSYYVENECGEEDFYNQDNLYDEDDYKMQYYTSIKEDLLEYFKDLRNNNYDLYIDFVSLLTLEYYNIVIQDIEPLGDCYDLDENDVFCAIKDMSKHEFLECLEYEENDYLEEIIECIIQEYDPEFKEVVSYDYLYVEQFLKEKEFQEIYEKFHPNLKAELKEINKYLCNVKLIDSCDMKFEKLFDYIYLALFTKANAEKSIYYHDILTYKLNDIKVKNEKLYNEILLYLIQFLYVYIKDKKDKSLIETAALETIEEEPQEDITYITDEEFLIENFYNYDILKHANLIQNLSEDVIKKTKKFIKK